MLTDREPIECRKWVPEKSDLDVVDETVTCVVQVKGKVRARLEVPPGIAEAELEQLALADGAVVAALGGAGIRKVIVRAPKLVNIVPA